MSSFVLDTCDLDFPLGVEDSNNCNPGHALVREDEVCQSAARLAGVTMPRLHGIMGIDFIPIRPEGCFKFPCSEDPKGFCYFFNPGPPAPDYTGAPAEANASTNFLLSAIGGLRELAARFENATGIEATGADNGNGSSSNHTGTLSQIRGTPVCKR